MAVPKIVGIETEYGVSLRGAPEPNPVVASSLLINGYVEQRRIGYIREIAGQFKQELDERLGIAEARISSVRDLTPEEKQLLEKQISAVTGKAIRPSYSRNPELLGGVVVRVGSTIYDGSVRGQLQRIRQQIATS